MGNLRRLIIREKTRVDLTTPLDQDRTLWFHSEFRDEFEAKLPTVIRFLREQKVAEEDVFRITAMVGELGNNSFDHNLGRWPNGYMGNFVALRYNKEDKTLEIVVIDLGVGFQESLKQNDPAPVSETEAIKMGLAGVTGRIGENRGNGLRTVKSWMAEYYQGKMRIQSNEGVIVVENNKTSAGKGEEIVGTEVYLHLKL